MAHRTAHLNEYGRNLLVTRVIAEGWTVSTATRAQGVSRATGYKWVRRFRAEGVAGLADRSSRPHHSPRRTAEREVARILAARLEWRWGPDRLGPLLGLPPSTVGAVLRRSGLPRLADIDRPTGLPVRRYEVCHPGALVHQDHKKLGRIPDGGGHRVLGRANAPGDHRAGLGYDHFEVIIDDRSRRASWSRSPDESGRSAAAALGVALAEFAAEGIARRAGPDRQRLGLSLERPMGPSWAGAATAAPGPIDRRPTARPSGSSGRSFASGRTPDRIAQTPSDSPLCRALSTSTISAARTLRSAASHPRPLSTTSVVTTPSRSGGAWDAEAAPPCRVSRFDRAWASGLACRRRVGVAARSTTAALRCRRRSRSPRQCRSPPPAFGLPRPCSGCRRPCPGCRRPHWGRLRRGSGSRHPGSGCRPPRARARRRRRGGRSQTSCLPARVSMPPSACDRHAAQQVAAGPPGGDAPHRAPGRPVLRPRHRGLRAPSRRRATAALRAPLSPRAAASTISATLVCALRELRLEARGRIAGQGERLEAQPRVVERTAGTRGSERRRSDHEAGDHRRDEGRARPAGAPRRERPAPASSRRRGWRPPGDPEVPAPRLLP